MRAKTLLISVVLLSVLGAVGYTLFYRAVEDPVYRGKRYSEWLYGKGKNRREALQAVGTEGIPFLLHEFEATDSALKKKLLAMLPVGTKDSLGLRPAELRRARSFCAFVGVADQAGCAVPRLCKMLDDPDPDIARRAASALGYMGKAAEPAIPALTRQLQSADPEQEKQLRRSLDRIERAVGRNG